MVMVHRAVVRDFGQIVLWVQCARNVKDVQLAVGISGKQQHRLLGLGAGMPLAGTDAPDLGIRAEGCDACPLEILNIARLELTEDAAVDRVGNDHESF